MALSKKFILLPVSFLFVSIANGYPGKPGNSSQTISSDGITIQAYDFDGFKAFLEKRNDTVYILNFWATWCKPCVKELPHFEELTRRYDDHAVRVILVSLDMRSQVESRLIPFIRERGLQSEVILLHDPDANSWIDQVDPEWSGAIPATLIYRNDSREFHEKAFSRDELFRMASRWINKD